MTPLLTQVREDSGLVKTEHSKEAQQILEVFDVMETASPVAELQGHKELVKVSYESEGLKSPLEVSTTTPVKSQQEIKSELRGQLSVIETAERRDSQSLIHKASLETVVIAKEPYRGLKVQTGEDRSLDSTGLAIGAIKHRGEVETEQIFQAGELKECDIEHVSSLLLEESTKAEENLFRAKETFEKKTKEFCSALEIVQNTRGAETKIDTSTESKTGRSRPPEKMSGQKHEITEKSKPNTVTDTELKSISKVQVIKPQNSVTDIELKQQKLVKQEKIKPVLHLATYEEEESKESRVPPKSREAKELRKTSEIKEGKESREATESWEPIEARELRQTSKTRELKDSRETSETRQIREPRESKETRELRETSKIIELEESKQPKETRQISEPSKTRVLEESKQPEESRELTERIAVPPQSGEIVKTEEVFLKDSIETESTGKRRSPLQTTGRGRDHLHPHF